MHASLYAPSRRSEERDGDFELVKKPFSELFRETTVGKCICCLSEFPDYDQANPGCAVESDDAKGQGNGRVIPRVCGI